MSIKFVLLDMVDLST